MSLADWLLAGTCCADLGQPLAAAGMLLYYYHAIRSCMRDNSYEDPMMHSDVNLYAIP